MFSSSIHLWHISEINTLARGASFSSDVVDSPDFVTKLSNVERSQRLDGWPADTLHLVAA